MAPTSPHCTLMMMESCGGARLCTLRSPPRFQLIASSLFYNLLTYYITLIGYRGVSETNGAPTTFTKMQNPSSERRPRLNRRRAAPQELLPWATNERGEQSSFHWTGQGTQTGVGVLQLRPLGHNGQSANPDSGYRPPLSSLGSDTHAGLTAVVRAEGVANPTTTRPSKPNGGPPKGPPNKKRS